MYNFTYWRRSPIHAFRANFEPETRMLAETHEHLKRLWVLPRHRTLAISPRTANCHKKGQHWPNGTRARVRLWSASPVHSTLQLGAVIIDRQHVLYIFQYWASFFKIRFRPIDKHVLILAFIQTVACGLGKTLSWQPTPRIITCLSNNKFILL